MPFARSLPPTLVRLALAAAVSAAAPGVPAMSRAPVPVVLVCQSAPATEAVLADGLCAAVAETLRERLDGTGRALVRGQADGDPAETTPTLRVVLNVVDTGPHEIAADLSWTDPGADPSTADSGASPLLRLTVQDTGLRPSMFAGLARALVSEAGLALAAHP